MGALILLLGLLAVGKAAAHWRRLPARSAEVLNRLILFLCLPAAILRHAPQLEFSPALLGVIAVPWGLLALSVALVSVFATALRLAPDVRGVLLLCVPLGNTSFLGYPLVEALLGAQALPLAVAYDQFGSFLILSTWGLWVLARHGVDTRPSVGQIGVRLLRFPPFLALLLGLAWMPAEPPAVIAALLRGMSAALLPLAALAVGLGLRFRLPRAEWTPLGVGLALKLALLPLAAWVWAQSLDLSAPLAALSVLQSAMPPMVTAAALAISQRLAPGLAAALVGYGTVLALVTLPAWHWLTG